MKIYQIIKTRDFFAIANKEDIKQYKNTHFLPYEKGMKFKKYLIELIENDEKYKNKVDYKTIYLY